MIRRSCRFASLPNQLIRRLAELAPRLQPELLHRAIGVYGLEDCVDLVAQVTPAQLSHLFDLDLWRPASPGLDERFDAERFGRWIEVLVEAGVELAAAKLAEMPLAQLVAGFAQHLLVFDVSAVSSYETTDGARIDYSRPVRDLVGVEIGGYHVAATREDAWDAIVAVLCALDMHHPDRFVALMRAVRSRSHSRREPDGFHSLLQNREQMMFDVAAERERRRQDRGFASPADARAFLQMSRSVKADALSPNPIARAYFRSMKTAAESQGETAASAEEYAVVAELLAEAGVTPLASPRALLTGAHDQAPPRLERLHAVMQRVCERDQVAYGERHAELAYLANVLMTGCSIQSRPFTAKEASDAAIATCNLGLEQLAAADGYLIARDLIGVFQVGWTALHEQVGMCAANALIDALIKVRTADDEMQSALNMLRIALMKQAHAGTPWRAAQSLDVIMMLDKPAWAALVALIAECPVIHAAIPARASGALTVEASAFEWISENAQIASVRGYLKALPATLA